MLGTPFDHLTGRERVASGEKPNEAPQLKGSRVISPSMLI